VPDRAPARAPDLIADNDAVLLDRWEWLGNSMGQWLGAALVFALVLTLGWGLRAYLRRRARAALDAGVRAGKPLGGIRGLLINSLARISRLMVFAGALFASSQLLALPDTAERVIRGLWVIGVAWQCVLWAGSAVRVAIDAYIARRRDDVPDEDGALTAAAGLASFIGRVVVYALIFLLALQNLGVDVTALIAGLGVGGIAVALAVQNILSDLFASLSIVLDKPFVVGDFIVTGQQMGTVERIGLKTTRVRALSGEQLVFSNNDLLTSRIQNYKRMSERRVVFTVGVVYATDEATLRAIPQILREAVEHRDDTRFDRAHLSRFGESSLDFEVVYFVLSADYNKFMDIHQAVLMEVISIFRGRSIEIAFPTQTFQLSPTAPLRIERSAPQPGRNAHSAPHDRAFPDRPPADRANTARAPGPQPPRPRPDR
jgi:small-conductance mechanosensitive channel